MLQCDVSNTKGLKRYENVCKTPIAYFQVLVNLNAMSFVFLVGWVSTVYRLKGFYTKVNNLNDFTL